jgi:hypothetical protein|nr:MAG TPA_asm: hypothetical protein [Caudoviricetes sp.]
MLDIRLNNSLKVLDKKFTACVLLASYKKPIKELLITSKGTEYIIKFSYKNMYFMLKYNSDFIQSNLSTAIVNIIQTDIQEKMESEAKC